MPHRPAERFTDSQLRYGRSRCEADLDRHDDPRFLNYFRRLKRSARSNLATINAELARRIPEITYAPGA